MDHLLKESWRLLKSSLRQLETREAPLGSSWRALGSAKGSSGELLEASWKLPEPTREPLVSSRPPGHSGDHPGVVLAWGGLEGGAVLELSWELWNIWRAPQAVVDAS